MERHSPRDVPRISSCTEPISPYGTNFHRAKPGVAAPKQAQDALAQCRHLGRARTQGGLRLFHGRRPLRHHSMHASASHQVGE